MYTVVKDVLQVLIVPISLAAFAYYWPLWLARTKREAFETLIRREIDEMYPLEDWLEHRDLPWWQLLPKRFVHERIFLEPSANRDFILSLNKDLAYHEFQLWTAIQKAMDATLEARKPGAEEAKKDEKRMLQQQARQWDFHLERVCTLIGGKEELHKKWRKAIEIRHSAFLDELPTPALAFWAR